MYQTFDPGVMASKYKISTSRLTHSQSSLTTQFSLVAHAVWWEKGKRRESSSLLPSLCRIPFPVKIFYFFQSPAPYFHQIPDPENTLSHPVLWPSENYKIYKLNDLSLETFYEFCKFFSLCKVRNCNALSKRRCWSLWTPASFLWKPALGKFF